MKYRPFTPYLMTLLLSALAGAQAEAQLRIVNYNVAQLGGNMTSLQAVFVALNADDKPGFAVAPHLYIFQEVRTTNVGPLLDRLNAAAPPGISYVQGTYTNFNENGTAGAQAMYYRPDVLVEDPSGHVDIFTQAGRYTDRWQLRLVGYDSPDAMFYIYSTHLKASTGSTNEQIRLTGATAIRNNADALPLGTHIIFGGDFNVYHHNEPAYLKFISAGTAQAIDPLGTGSWLTASNAIKHTQSPCRTNCPLVGGGMDDRFDFQLSTAAFHDGDGLSIIPGTYRAFGNDGNHYDIDINAGNNTYYPTNIPRSNALANHLWAASDHVPVIAEYQIPAVLHAEVSEDFGRVIQGAAFELPVMLTNAASVIVQEGADLLHYQVAGSGVLAGGESGSIPAMNPPTVVHLPVDTTVVGPALATVQIESDSQAVQGAPAVLQSTGRIVRHAQPSFETSEPTDTLVVPLMLSADSGSHPIDVEIRNLGYDSDQALLDIDDVQNLTAPFALASPLPTGIAEEPAIVAFSVDTNGIASGVHEHVLTIMASDEDIPGEAFSALTLTFTLVVPSVNADVNCDGEVNFKDVASFVDVLLEIDTTPCHVERADFNFSGAADAQDIADFLRALLNL